MSCQLSVVHVEGCFYLVVFDAEVAAFFHVAFQGMVAGSVGLDGWQSPWALPKGKLFAGYDVSGGCPVATVFQADFVGDVVVGRAFQQGFHRRVYGAAFTGRAVGQAESLFFDEVSVAFQAVVQVEVCQIEVRVAVVQFDFVGVIHAEGDVLVDLFHFQQLGCDAPVGCDKTVVAEVIVVGHVAKAAAEVVLVVRPSRFVQSLVYPVPDASAYHAV